MKKSSYYKVDDQFIDELFLLQSELVKLQKYISDKKRRLAIVFEGRDTAGKGAAVARVSQFMNPQYYRAEALGKPSKRERGQWYFQRYIKKLPNAGEIVLFDRSWYNRAVVEPVMGFCDNDQYELFMNQVPSFEKMIIDDGIILVKFWFSIESIAQKDRIQKRLESPLELWKVSPVDLAAQEKWEDFTQYKNEMFSRTHSDLAPWIIVSGAEREFMRIQAMRYILSLFDYSGKSKEVKSPDFPAIKKYQA